jgi:hypothetical protein
VVRSVNTKNRWTYQAEEREVSEPGAGSRVGGIGGAGWCGAGGTAASPKEIVLASNRTTGQGVNNPQGDIEIFKMNPDGTGVKQLTFNEAPPVSPPSVLLMGTAGDEFWMNR